VPRFDLVAFDLYGTLLDVSGLASRIEAAAGSEAAALLPSWRAAQLERSWRIASGAPYESWDAVTLRALEDVAPAMRAEMRQRLAALWATVPAYPDARAALEALGSQRVRRVVLSNGTRGMIRSALDAAGLDVDAVLSADDVRTYKTDPRVYALLDALADPSRTLFVSSNGWDADGAGRTGRIVAWIDRGGAPPAAPPRYRVTSLSDVAGLAGGEPSGPGGGGSAA
jgi:2-haloacid dehalogenase